MVMYVTSAEGEVCMKSFFRALYTEAVYTNWCSVTTNVDTLAWDTPYSRSGITWLLNYVFDIYPHLTPAVQDDKVELIGEDSAGDWCDTFLHAVFGENIFHTWRHIREQLGFNSEAQFITWLTDVLNETSHDLRRHKEKHPLRYFVRHFKHNPGFNNSVPEAARYICKVCGYQATAHATMIFHMESQHVITASVIDCHHQSSKEYTCVTCNYTSNNPYFCLNHLYCHADVRKYQCLICTRAYKRLSHLSEHIRCVHLKLRRLPIANNKTNQRSRDRIIAQTIDAITYICMYCKNKYTGNTHTCEQMPSDVDGCKSMFACSLCEFTCEYKNVLQQHQTDLHGAVRPYKCDDCGKTYEQNSHLMAHIIRSHNGIKRLRLRTAVTESCYRCSECNDDSIVFNTKQEYKGHIQAQHGGVIRKCVSMISKANRCYQKITINVNLPIDVAKDDQIFQCQLCPDEKVSFENKSLSRDHVNDVHGKTISTYSRDKCKVVTSVGNSSHIQLRSHLCPLCGKPFTRKSDVLEHMKRLHKNYGKCLADFGIEVNDPFMCDHCSFNTLSSKQFKHHLKSKHGGGLAQERIQYTCEKCGRSFKYGKSFHHHVLTKHTDGDNIVTVTGKKRGYVCEHCGKEYGQIGKFREHVRMKHPADGVFRKPYKCSLCDKTFALERYVSDHMKKTHLIEGEKCNYGCVTCGKWFRFHHQWKVHMLKHSTSKDYRCTYCHKAFKYKHGFIRHVRSLHEHCRTHSCNQCNYSGSTADGLKQHQIYVHNRPTPFMCDHCFKYFPCDSHLQTHRSKHNTVSQENDDIMVR